MRADTIKTTPEQPNSFAYSWKIFTTEMHLDQSSTSWEKRITLVKSLMKKTKQ